MVDGHVEVIRHVREGQIGDLGVNVRVPRKHLAVPPPTQQCAVRYPSFKVIFFEEAEVCANHVVEAVGSLVVSYDAVEISAVIVAVDVGGTAFSKVSMLNESRNIQMYGRLTQAHGSTCAAPLPALQGPPDTFLSTASSFLLVTERAMVMVARQVAVLQEESLKSAQTDMPLPRIQCIAEFSCLQNYGDECDHS